MVTRRKAQGAGHKKKKLLQHMRNHDIALAERWHEANEIQHAIVFGDTFQMSRSHGSVGMASLLWR